MFKVLSKIYQNREDWVAFELNEISAVHEQEVASREKNGGYLVLTV